VALTPVTIEGMDFPLDATSVTVTFGGNPGTDVVVVSATRITVTAPARPADFSQVIVTFHFGPVATVVMEEHFTAAATEWTQGFPVPAHNVYDTPTSPNPGSAPYDPLYPYIVAAEAMRVVGGKADWDQVYGGPDGYVAAGFVLRGFPTFDGTRGRVEATYTPTADSLGDAYFHLPLTVMGVDVARFNIQVSVEGIGPGARHAPFTLALSAFDWEPGANPEASVVYPFVADAEYAFLLDWQCGTVVGAFTDVLQDGWVRLFINGVLALELTNLSLWIDDANANAVHQVWLGFYGLLGPVDDIYLRTIVDAQPDVVATYTPLALAINVPTPSAGGWGIERFDAKVRREDTA
jgi:hypothetical protein